MLYNLEAEKYLLGSLFIDQQLIKEITLKPEHFYSTKNQVIFQAMKDAEKAGEPTDIVTVYQALSKQDRESIGVEYLNNLSASIPTVENYKVYEKLIRNSWKLRSAKLIAKKLDTDLELADDTQIISDAIQKLTRLEEVGYVQEFDMQRTLVRILNSLENPKKGITTGFYDLDAFTNGWQDEDLIVIGARPSMGKTAFALNTALHASKKDTVVTLFSLEMPEDSLVKRLICTQGKIDATKMRNPKLFQSQDWENVTMAMGVIERLPIHIYDNPLVSVQEIRAKLRHLKRKYPDKKHLCIIDYLQLIQGDGRENRNLEVGTISRSLKIIAREFKMPIIVLSQLSRGVEQRQDKRPMLSDLRESGSIEQDADVALFLYRDDYYNQDSEDKNVIEIIIAKQRNGATGRIKLEFIKEYNEFRNLTRG